MRFLAFSSSFTAKTVRHVPYHRSLTIARGLASDLAARAADADGKLTVADLVFRGEFAPARALLDADGDENGS
jgi:hypothetical protein